MFVICDAEADGLKPTKIWIVVCKDAASGENYVFKNFHEPGNIEAFQAFATNVSCWIGHNFIQFDAPALRSLLGVEIDDTRIIDTLVVSRLLDSDIAGGHSLEAWGQRLGKKKAHAGIEDWSQFTPEMEERCISDTEINWLLYQKFHKYIVSPRWKAALRTEHFITARCLEMRENGFSFDLPKAKELLKDITLELETLDSSLKESFLPKVLKVTEVLPKGTKHGTLNRTDFRFLGADADLTPYGINHAFTRIEFQEFSPGSAKQRIERLNEAGWRPTEKTKGHVQCERDLRSLRRKRRKTDSDQEEIKRLEGRLVHFQTYGWTTSEENLSTLPEDAPEAARKLAQWLMLSNRCSTLVSWLNVCTASPGDWRIHGSFNGIGAWTGRMSHANPNMGNIPKFDAKQPHKTPYSDRMRALWRASPGRYLVGVDAESIQLRIFGHYIDDPEFIAALLEGKKEDGTDPHSVNQRALGQPCKSRDDAKTFIYGWLLGAGIGKVALILGCSRDEAEEACINFVRRYPGLQYLKDHVIPEDAERGYFTGLDGRSVYIFGDDFSSRRHFALAGYLQNGESVIMKRAVQIWHPRLRREGVPFWMVNFVHDEFQVETVRDKDTAIYVARTIADAISQVGTDLGLRCPMAGSILGAGIPDPTDTTGKLRLAIGDNWLQTH